VDTIPFALPDISDWERAAVDHCLKSGWLTSGRKVKEFEEAFAAYVGAKHAIAVNSATMAALLILDALGVGPGDEVIVPTYTFSGPAMMAHRLGAKVVLADCLPGSYQIDPDQVRRKITDRTKVVMPTHFGGSACAIDQLKALCDSRGIAIVDDAAHAFPTRYPSGDLVGNGTYTRATFFSFYATKTITTGEGGMVTTNDDDLAKHIRHLRLHGFDRAIYDRYTNIKTGWRYDIAYPGWKANMTDIAAAMGIVQLKRADFMRVARTEIAALYGRNLADLEHVILPKDDKGSAWHLYPIRVRQRDRFIEEMAARCIQCSVHFIPLHQHSYWRSAVAGNEEFPNADMVFAQSVSLPIYSTLTKEETDRVIAAIREVEGSLARGTE